MAFYEYFILYCIVLEGLNYELKCFVCLFIHSIVLLS